MFTLFFYMKYHVPFVFIFFRGSALLLAACVHQGRHMPGALRLRNQRVSDGCAHDTAGGGYQWGLGRGTPLAGGFFWMGRLNLEWMIWGYPITQETSLYIIIYICCIVLFLQFSQPKEVVFLSWGDVLPGVFGTLAGSRFFFLWFSWRKGMMIANLMMRQLVMYGNQWLCHFTLCWCLEFVLVASHA